MPTRSPGDAPGPHKRRPRYKGKYPRAFRDKYKELDPARYRADVDKIVATGKTPAGSHRPIMVNEVLDCLRPAAGEIAVDATLGGGGHAEAILRRLRPGGRLLGLDVDPRELPKTEARLRAAGFAREEFTAQAGTFAGLIQAVAMAGLAQANVILADLGVSSMQLDNPDRGFSYKGVGPLDMRMNPSRGRPASAWLAEVSEEDLARVLTEHADEPHAGVIAALLKERPFETTQAVERQVRLGLTTALPKLTKADVKLSVRRTFQALRIAVNDEFGALEAFLRAVPLALAPGGRVAIITFHSGEDRRVKKAFQAGYRAAQYAEIADQVIRATYDETRANRRAAPAKLRWAVAAG